MNEDLKKLLAEFVEKISPILSEKTEDTKTIEEAETVEEAEMVEDVGEVEATEEVIEEAPAEITKTETTVVETVESIDPETGEETVKRTEENIVTFKDGVYYGI